MNGGFGPLVYDKPLYFIESGADGGFMPCSRPGADGLDIPGANCWFESGVVFNAYGEWNILGTFRAVFRC